MKIEGPDEESPRYTAGGGRHIQKVCDLYLEKGRKGYRVEKEDRQRLLGRSFEPGRTNRGYYRQHNGRDMVVMKEKPSFRQENKNCISTLTRRMWRQN